MVEGLCLGFMVEGLGYRVYGFCLLLKVYGLWFRVNDLGFRVCG